VSLPILTRKGSWKDYFLIRWKIKKRRSRKPFMGGIFCPKKRIQVILYHRNSKPPGKLPAEKDTGLGRDCVEAT